MENTNPPLCITCAAWTGNRQSTGDLNQEMGECRMNPPQIGGIIPQQTMRGTVPSPVTSFPLVRAAQWCLQYRPHVAIQTVQ